MSYPVSTFTHLTASQPGMFRFTAHWAGMVVTNVGHLPKWAFKVLDPEIGMERTLYIRLKLNPDYTGVVDHRAVHAERAEMLADGSLFNWYCSLGVAPAVAQDAVSNVPIWGIVPNYIPPMGVIQAAGQMIPYKMQFGPLFTLVTYRSMKRRTVDVRSNILGKVTVGDEVFPWFLIYNPAMSKMVSSDSIGWLACPDREALGKSLDEEFLKRWPFYARPGMEDLLPKFEVLGKDGYNTTFPDTRIIVDHDGWK